MGVIRTRLGTLMAETVTDAHNWTYKAVRPLPIPATWSKGQKVISDCSWGVNLLNKWAGAPSPMHNDYAPWGNSSTIAATNRHADHPSQLRVGDFVTFGPGGDEHAATVYETGSDPNLWSDGHQGAPNFYRLSQDPRVHQLRFNDFPDEAPPPLTPAQKLRAKTGYWSWLAWKLGEGDWAHYKPGDKKVRPNVPKVIPAGWWKLYAKFLYNRKRP